MSGSPVAWKAGWTEEIAPTEEADFKALAEQFAALQADRDARYSEKARTLHRKGTGGLLARFVVRPDLADVLPPELRVGPFTPGAEFKAYVRFSNGTWDRRSDKAPDIRGIALKLLGVPGKKLLTGKDEPDTQDFLLIQTPTTPVRSPQEFATLVRLAAAGSEAVLPFRLLFALGPRTTLAIIRSTLATATFGSNAKGRFHSVTPYRFGPAAARFRLVPARADHPDNDGSRDGLKLALDAAARDGLSWEFQAQFYQDPTATPIEDPRVDWAEAVAPWTALARVEVPPTDPASEAAREVATLVEGLAFDLWHGVEELRPLGAINRARKVAYFPSQQSRGALPEP